MQESHVNTAEVRINFIKRYGVVGVVVVLAPFVTPFIGDWLEQKIQASNIKAMEWIIHNQGKEITREIRDISASERENIADILNYNLRVAIEAHARKNLNNEDVIHIIKVSVGYQSIHKVFFIKHLLYGYNKEEVSKFKDTIKNTIKAELTSQSSIYINSLNRYRHDKIGLLGKWVDKSFPMEEFLQEIFRIALDDNVSVNKRSDNVMYKMLEYQNKLLDKLEEDLK